MCHVTKEPRHILFRNIRVVKIFSVFKELPDFHLLQLSTKYIFVSLICYGKALGKFSHVANEAS